MINDGDDQEVARVTKEWAGSRPEMESTADTDVLEIHYPLRDRPATSKGSALACTTHSEVTARVRHT